MINSINSLHPSKYEIKSISTQQEATLQEDSLHEFLPLDFLWNPNTIETSKAQITDHIVTLPPPYPPISPGLREPKDAITTPRTLKSESLDNFLMPLTAEELMILISTESNSFPTPDIDVNYSSTGIEVQG